jgi:hypothetical protein
VRTTLAIDDDVLIAVKERARHEGRSAGAVLSDLARQALTAHRIGDADESGEAPSPFFGFEPIPHRGGTVSNDLIDELRDESD